MRIDFSFCLTLSLLPGLAPGFLLYSCQFSPFLPSISPHPLTAPRCSPLPPSLLQIVLEQGPSWEPPDSPPASIFPHSFFPTSSPSLIPDCTGFQAKLSSGKSSFSSFSGTQAEERAWDALSSSSSPQHSLDSHCPSTNLLLEGPCDLVIIPPQFYLSFSTLAIHSFIQQVFVEYLLRARCIDFSSRCAAFLPPPAPVCIPTTSASKFRALRVPSPPSPMEHINHFLCFGNGQAIIMTGSPTLRNIPKD